MYLNTNECFQISKDGNVKINVTRFGDFFVMASRGNDDERDYYKEELKYIIDKSKNALENGNTIGMVKTYENVEKEELRYVFNKLNEFNDYVEIISKVANIKGL